MGIRAHISNTYISATSMMFKTSLLASILAGYATSKGVSSANGRVYSFKMNGESYNESAKFCAGKDARLASKAEILAFRNDAMEGDVWTPVSDSSNEWLQIGKAHHNYGKLHTEVDYKVKPSWGKVHAVSSYRKLMYCVKSCSIVNGRNVCSYDMNGESWGEAADFCVKKGHMGLAFKSDVLGFRNGAMDTKTDVWTPLGDSANQWMTIGGQYEYGKLHAEVAGAKPAWGKVHGGSDVHGASYKKLMYCVEY